VRKVDASVRFVAAWPMRLRGSIPGVTTPIHVTEFAGLAARSPGTDLREEAP
jgi:hypothetical protein